MLWVVGAESMQFTNEFACDALGAFEFGSAVDHAMADADDTSEAEIFFEPANDRIATGAVVGSFNRKLL